MSDLVLARLESSLSFWEYAGYGAFASVIICCLAEYLHVIGAWHKRDTWWTMHGGSAAALLLVVALAAELITQFRTNAVSGRIVAQQNADAAITEIRLLNERRLTARERMVLEFLWRAVVPRSRLVNGSKLSSSLREGHFSRINLAVVQDAESQDFGMFLMIILKNAGVLGRAIDLPKDGPMQIGLSVASPDPARDKLIDMLWQKFQIGGGGMSMETATNLFPSMKILPNDEDCLIVGTKNEAMQPMPGQPGEGTDQYGGPDPGPH